MKAREPRVWNLIALLLIGGIFIGFRLVTQAGQAGYVMQNDGYAVSGGLIILAGGIGLGQWLAKKDSEGKKG